MVQLKIAFLDGEKEYLKQLRGYLIGRREKFFKVRTFCDTESYFKATEEEEYHATVVTEQFICDVLKKKEKKTKLIFLREKKIPKCAEQLPCVEKYQSAEKIFAQIAEIVWQETENEAETGRQAVLVGVYSPIHYESQMLFSMTMAQIYGGEQSVLYVNLMENSGFYALTDTEIRQDVGDLICAVMQNEHDFTTGLHKIKRRIQNFDYIPPAVNPEHLSEITTSVYEKLFLELKKHSGYDVVLVDFGTLFAGFAELLPMFREVYCLGKEGVLNRYRMEEFTDYLKKAGEERLTNVKRLVLAEQLVWQEEAKPLEWNLYGGMGDYVRRCMEKGEESEE